MTTETTKHENSSVLSPKSNFVNTGPTRHRNYVLNAKEHFKLSNEDFHTAENSILLSDANSNYLTFQEEITQHDSRKSLSLELRHKLLSILYEIADAELSVSSSKKAYEIFLLPVEDLKYKRSVPFPIDFATIHARLAGDIYCTQKAFEVDLFDLTSNMIWAYGPDHELARCAMHLEKRYLEIASHHGIKFLRYENSLPESFDNQVFAWQLQGHLWQEYLSLWTPTRTEVSNMESTDTNSLNLLDILKSLENPKLRFEGIENRLRMGSYRDLFTFHCDMEAVLRDCFLDPFFDPRQRETLRFYVLGSLKYHAKYRYHVTEMRNEDTSDEMLSVDFRRHLLSSLETLQQSPSNLDAAFSYPPLAFSPRYIQTVRNPMDLYTMRCKVYAGKYLTRLQILEDLNQIAENSELFNTSNSSYTSAARELARSLPI